MIFRRVADGRPYPEHDLSAGQWAEIPPSQVRLDDLTTTKTQLDLEHLLDDDSTFFGDLFAHVVSWEGELFLEDGLHRALRAALQQRNMLHARVHTIGKKGMILRVFTLLGSAVVFVVGLFAGFQMLTAKPPEPPPVATCEPRTVAAGQPLTTNVVTVNVFNASKRSGLANRVNINLQRNGFLGGQIGNSKSAAKPAPVTILTNETQDPRVKLVAAQFQGKVKYAVPDVTVKEGVVIVIGDGFTKLKSKPKRSIVAATDVTTCVPIVALP